MHLISRPIPGAVSEKKDLDRGQLNHLHFFDRSRPFRIDVFPNANFWFQKIQLESSRPMAVVPFKNDWEVFVREVTRLEYAPAEGDHCFIFDRLPPSTRVTRRFWLTI